MNVFVKTPAFVPLVLKNCIWNKNRDEKIIYLTFDDGPVPEITEFVLDTLQSFGNIKATFFCIGNNVEKYQDEWTAVNEAGHSIGNHTHHHMNGWKTITKDYIKDVALCNRVVNSTLFRPPYGKLKLPQLKHLAKNYSIIMWDVLSYDWVNTISENDVLKNVSENATNGSIVVFHDSIKAEKNLKYALPRFIEEKLNKGFSFAAL
jgi:peptidoglycan/xylan/chitin deacetylase (PgdA/CDA1 family)